MNSKFTKYNVQAVWEAEGSFPRMHPKIRILGSKGVPITTLPVTDDDFPTILQVATEAVRAARDKGPALSETIAKSVVDALQAHGVLISVDIEEYVHNLNAAAEAVCEVKTDDDGSEAHRK